MVFILAITWEEGLLIYPAGAHLQCALAMPFDHLAASFHPKVLCASRDRLSAFVLTNMTNMTLRVFWLLAVCLAAVHV
jgi:hypothetical protein